MLKFSSNLIAALLTSVAARAADITFVPTSDIVRMAEIIVKANGYDLSKRREYFFDLLKEKNGMPLIAGFTTLGFYWNGDLVETIAVDEHSGFAIGTTSCSIYAYPALRRYQTSPPADAPAAVKEATGCDSFRVLSVAKARSRSPSRYRR